MKTSNERYAIDANVILRFLLNDDLALSQQAIAIFAAIERGEMTAFLDPVILAEVVWVLNSFYKLPPAQIAAELLILVKSDQIILSDRDMYISALELYAGGRLHFGDACACAVAKRQCDGKLLSFDRKLDRIAGICRTETM